MEHLTRRKLIVSGLAGTGALAVAAVPVIAASAVNDAKLLQLCRNWHRIQRALDRACDHLQAAEDTQLSTPMPATPAILKERFETWPGHFEVPSLFSIPNPASVAILQRADLRRLAEGKVWMEAGLIEGNDPADETLTPVPQAARAHARRCLRAHDQWQAAIDRRNANHDKWKAVCTRLHLMHDKASEQIAALPAHTMEGFRAKLSVFDGEPLYAEEMGVAKSVLEDARRFAVHAHLTPPPTA